jgi:hypothetical protein
MSLNRSINSASALGVGGILILSMVGCSTTPSIKYEVDVAPAMGYVRLAALIAEHPLQREVRRLRAMEARLKTLMPPVTNILNATEQLPALPNNRSVSGMNAAALERREREREALRKTVETQLAQYIAERQARTARLLDQQRAELLGVATAKDAARAQRERENIEAQTLKSINEIRDAKLEVYKYLAFYTGQLNRPVDYIVPPGVNVRNLPPPGRLTPGVRAPILPGAGAADQTKETTASPTLFPTMAERLEAYRLSELGELQRIETEIRRIKGEGRNELTVAERDARARRLAEIEAQLDAFRDDMEIAQILRAQRQALESVLVAEDAAMQESAMIGKNQNADRGLDLSLPGIKFVPPGAFSTERAITRLKAQRQELESLIRIVVSDAVKDIARNQDTNVVIVDNSAGNPTQRATLSNRKDMTLEFQKRLAAGVPASSSVKGGRL